jgi:hypothetical protein
MRNQRYRWGFAIFAAVSTLYNAADAQSTSPNTSTGSAGTSASAGLQQNVQLSPQEQLLQADASVARMRVSSATVRRGLEQARQQRDVVKTLCLNDKLNQIDIAMRSAQDRRTTLDQAVTRRDADLANHEFTILQVLRQRVDQLDFEARQCLGEELQFLGDTKIITNIDPGMPSEETTSFPDPVPVLSAPANCESCYD